MTETERDIEGDIEGAEIIRHSPCTTAIYHGAKSPPKNIIEEEFSHRVYIQKPNGEIYWDGAVWSKLPHSDLPPPSLQFTFTP